MIERLSKFSNENLFFFFLHRKGVCQYSFRYVNKCSPPFISLQLTGLTRKYVIRISSQPSCLFFQDIDDLQWTLNQSCHCDNDGTNFYCVVQINERVTMQKKVIFLVSFLPRCSLEDSQLCTFTLEELFHHSVINCPSLSTAPQLENCHPSLLSRE